jgi:hypothetical protein
MEKNYPTINLNSDQITNVKDWQVNGVYEVKVTMKMTGTRKAEPYDIPVMDAAEGSMPANNIMVGTFDIIDVQVETESELADEDPVEKYESDYHQKMSKPSPVKAAEKKTETITININK